MDIKQPIRVVIADDESSIRNGLHSAIPWEKLNMTVAGIAKDGAEALDFILAYQADIAITDIRMPRMTGLELIERCHNRNLNTQFIILSGYDDFSYAQTAIRYGARAYVLKPLKIDELLAELDNLRQELEKKQEKAVLSDTADYHALQIDSKKLFLNQLIQNEFHHSSDICRKLAEFPTILREAPYRVLVYSIRQIGEEPIPGIASQIESVVSGQLKSPDAEVWESSSSYVIAILYLPKDEVGFQLRPLAGRCFTQLKNIPGYHVAIGIGSIEQELIHADRSYSTALTALSYQLYEADQDIYDESVICNEAPTFSTSSIDTDTLIHAIRKNSREEICQYLKDYFQSLLYVPMPPPSFIRGMSIYLVTEVQNTLRRQFPNDTSLFEELPYTELNKLSTFRQLQNWTIELFSYYGEAVSQCLKDHKDSIIVEAKRYIKEHISQKIPAEDVAAHINLSTSYFTIYFKAKTGVNFRDYVLGIKMEHAKHLLETEAVTISEVSYATGYDDYRSFYRAFKNYTGLTPSEYQTLH